MSSYYLPTTGTGSGLKDSGTVTLAGASTTVNTPFAAATALYFLTNLNFGGTAFNLRIGTIVPGVSFQIIPSNGALDTSSVQWSIF